MRRQLHAAGSHEPVRRGSLGRIRTGPTQIPQFGQVPSPRTCGARHLERAPPALRNRLNRTRDEYQPDAAQPDAQATPPWQIHLVEANQPMFRNSMTDWVAPCRTGTVAYMTNVISCLSLWMSILVAIWFVRGWIGLFFSGQVLSAGICLFQILAKRTHYAFFANKKPAHEFEVEWNQSSPGADSFQARQT